MYVALCVVLFFSQRSLIYFPQKSSSPPGTSVMRLKNEVGELVVTRRDGAGNRALIYFGGNAENVDGSLSVLEKAFPDETIYLSHYRGYGGSAGTPSELALHSDAVMLFDALQPQHEHITVLGRSLGSGVATYLASTRPVSQLILVTPYNSILELAQQQFPLFPVSLLLQDKFESWKYAAQVRAPTLLITADNDEIIPRESSNKLLAAFVQTKARLHVIKGTGHNSISQKSDYIAALRAESSVILRK